MNKITSCLNSITSCKSQKNKGPGSSSHPFEVTEEMFPVGIVQFIVQEKGRILQIIQFQTGTENISFEPKKENTAKDNLPPLQFTNQKYNVMLKVSHTEYKKSYQDFQKTVKDTAFLVVPDLMNSIKTKKPAAIRIDADLAIAGQLGMSPFAAHSNRTPEGMITLTEAANFVSDNDNVIMPVCQLHKAFHNMHLFNITTGALLKSCELREFEHNYKADLQKQTAIKSGGISMRNVLK